MTYELGMNANWSAPKHTPISKSNISHTHTGMKFLFDFKMKLTVLLIIVSLFKINASSNSWNTKLDLKVDDLTIEHVFNMQVQISGTVFGEDGVPLAGASVIEKGTSNGTQTDFDGNFTISVASENAILVVSYVGFTDEEVTPGAQTNITVNLTEDTSTLEEVVIVGYGTQKKVNLTGAVSAISSERLQDRPIINVGQGLQGLIPNLNITSADGAAGSPATFNIRGFTSTNGGVPLVLVDGVIMDPNLVNPSEIESISVLKDAASAAIYGSRAAFGVVLITTKSGVGRRPVVELSSNYSFNKPTNIPDLLDQQQLVAWRETSARNLGQGAPYSEEVKAALLAHYNDPVNNPAAYVDPNDPTKYIYVGSTDWYEEIYRDFNPTLQTTVSLRGSSDKLNYYFSAGLLQQDGILRVGNDSYDRHNLRIKLDYNITDWVQLNLNTVFTRTKQDQAYNYPGIGTLWHDITGNNIFLPVTNPDGSNTQNSLSLLKDGGRDVINGTDSWVTLGATLTPFEGFQFTGSYSYNSFDQLRKRHKKAVSRYNGPAEFNGEGQTVHTTPTAIFLNTNRNDYYAINLVAEYEHIIAGDHYIKGTLGFNEERKNFSGTNSSNTFLITDALPALNLTTGTPSAGEFLTSWALQGYFYRLNYIFKDRYLLETSGRYDATSRFSAEDRWALFPSISAGWRISNEPFFEGLRSVVDNLKFRASFGGLGNQSFGDFFPYIPRLGSFRAGAILDNDRPLSVQRPLLVSSTLTWETAVSRNYGVDATLFDSRLNFSFDLFERKVIDQLGPAAALPATLGVAPPRANAVETLTKGWEVESFWRDRIGQVYYNIGFNLADAQGEITHYDNPTKSLTTFYVGQKIGEIWGLEANGLFDSREEYLSSGLDYSNRTARPIEGGDVWYVDQNGDGIIDFGTRTVDDSGDFKIIGNSTPRYSYGITLGTEWKGLAIDIFLQGIGKRELSLSGPLFWPNGPNPQQKHLDYWTESNKDAYWPRLIGGAGNFNYSASDRYLQDFSYLRMKQLSISYTFPYALLEEMFVQSARIYFTGQNLFEIDNISEGFDPETSLGGQGGWGTGKSYSFARSFSIGFNVTF